MNQINIFTIKKNSIMRISKMNWKKERTLGGFMIYYLLYLFWGSSNFSKLYQNGPIGISIGRLEVLTC